jgi:replicative DNA helicase
MAFETTILRNLLHNEQYLRQVIPFLKEEYFVDPNQCRVFQTIRDFVDEYNAPPTIEALTVIIENTKVSSGELEAVQDVLKELDEDVEVVNLEWLIDTTEDFVKKKAIFQAVQKCVFIMGGADEKQTADAFPAILQEALGISFDDSVGHDYFEDGEERFKSYTDVKERLRFDIDWMNTITNGGVPKKKLCVITGAINVGKTLILCHFAASYLSQGKNVLYITLEIADEEIAQRIDANLMNIAVNDLALVPPDTFKSRLDRIRDKTEGRLFVKEYAAGSVHAGHFRALLSELALKQEFVPEVIMVDMLDGCASSRVKRGDNTNSYFKSVAQELRGLASESNTVMWSALQFNRTGMESSDPEMTDTGYAIGVPEVADLDLAVTQNETMEKLNQYLFKQLKNRLNSKAQNRRFIVGVDTAKMRLYNADWEAQKGIVEEVEEPLALPAMRFSRETGEIFDEIKT